MTELYIALAVIIVVQFAEIIHAWIGGYADQFPVHLIIIQRGMLLGIVIAILITVGVGNEYMLWVLALSGAIIWTFYMTFFIYSQFRFSAHHDRE